MTKGLKRFVSDYSMALALLLLCVYYSFATYKKQYPTGSEAAKTAVKEVNQGPVLVIAQSGTEAKEFAEDSAELLKRSGIKVVDVVIGEPSDMRTAVNRLIAEGKEFRIIVTTKEAAGWGIVERISNIQPALGALKVISPQSYYWPDFLKKSNLLAIADRIVVIAIIAIGMTMVIITGGIDLSVGSLIAFSAVMTTLLIRDFGGAREATSGIIVLCCLVAIAACGVTGLFSGTMVAAFGIPPFIATLAMMLVASGLAYILAGGQSIYEVPPSIDWLGRGSNLLGIPNTVVLMILLYALAHILMSRMVVGRYIYATGGSSEAARLSGVPVKRILLLVYAISGALAGLGGVIQASQLQTGAPTYGQTYELHVIAAVVVGGTSLGGGQGKILGTLIGAFIIAVIQNGMNLTGVESYAQKVILGLVILGALLLDMIKKRGWSYLRFLTTHKTARLK